jgi:nitrogen fixation NifU-like protein
MFVRVSRGCITEVRFQAYGCGATIAAASLASELMVGRAVGDLLHLKAEEIEQALDGLPADRRHAADVVAEALRAVARDWRRREDHGV